MYFLSLLQLSIIITLTMVKGVITRIFSVKGILICGFPFVLSLGRGLNRRSGGGLRQTPRGPRSRADRRNHTGSIVLELFRIISLNLCLTKRTGRPRNPENPYKSRVPPPVFPVSAVSKLCAFWVQLSLCPSSKYFLSSDNANKSGNTSTTAPCVCS